LKKTEGEKGVLLVAGLVILWIGIQNVLPKISIIPLGGQFAGFGFIVVGGLMTLLGFA